MTPKEKKENSERLKMIYNSMVDKRRYIEQNEEVLLCVPTIDKNGNFSSINYKSAVVVKITNNHFTFFIDNHETRKYEWDSERFKVI